MSRFITSESAGLTTVGFSLPSTIACAALSEPFAESVSLISG
jgi:hypothetical protein